MFTDQPIAKNRPALILSSSDYHASRREVIIAAITSHIRSPVLVGDHPIEEWQACGLVKPSVVTSILWTVRASMIRRKLGALSAKDMSGFQRSLSRALGL
jgi:mRNA-degrading endonuclease toxin of MazEF toxin-antitoxin module